MQAQGREEHPQVNAYATIAPWPGLDTSHGASGPAATFAGAIPHQRIPRAPKHKDHDATKDTGMVPGMDTNVLVHGDGRFGKPLR